MWKIVVGFIVFAALALWLLTKGGEIDMSGEKHGVFSPEGHVLAALVVPTAHRTAVIYASDF